MLLSRGAPVAALYGAFGLMGLFTLPILPGVIENAVEVTYPIPEEASSGLLFCSGNLVGVGFTLFLSHLVARDDVDTSAFWTPAAAFLLVSIAVCVCLVLSYAGEYKRLAAEHRGTSNSSSGGGGGGGGGGSASRLSSPLLEDDHLGDLVVPPTGTSSPRSPGPQRSSPTEDSVQSLEV